MDEKHLERIRYTFERCIQACQNWLEICRKSGKGVSVEYVQCVKQTKACTEVCSETMHELHLHISHFKNNQEFVSSLESSIKACQNFIDTCQSCIIQCEENDGGVQGINCVMACKDCSQACEDCIAACNKSLQLFKNT